jgi:Rrf2 family protein
MQITQTADYAVRTVVYLALHGNGGPVAASVIAKEMIIPSDYISKVVQALARAGLVESVAGRNGGAQLARAPGELSMLEIVEAVDGPVTLTRCVTRPGACPRDTYCVVHGFWQTAQDGLVGLLSKTTIAEICRPREGHGPLGVRRQIPGA